MAKAKLKSARKKDGFKIFILGAIVIFVLLSVIFVNNSKVSKDSEASSYTNCQKKYSKKDYKLRLCAKTCGIGAINTGDKCNKRGWVCCLTPKK